MALVASEEHEYFKAVGKRAIADLWKYHNHPENFQSSKFSEGEIKVYTMKSDNPDCPEDIAKASISLEGTTLNHALALVLPWMPYRTQWDDLLARVKVLDEISPTMKIVHHVTKKKTPLSARDSVDVVSIDARKSTSTVILAARSVEKADVPELKDHVRTFQHLGGFVIQDCGEGKIDFELYFHGDLKVEHNWKNVWRYSKGVLLKNLAPALLNKNVSTAHCNSEEDPRTALLTQSLADVQMPVGNDSEDLVQPLNEDLTDGNDWEKRSLPPRLGIGSRIRLFLLMSILTSIANFPSAFTHTSINTAVHEVNEYLNRSYAQREIILENHHISIIRSTINCVWYLGQVGGALASPFICDKYGRKVAFILSSSFVTLGALLQFLAVFSSFPEIFFIGRVLAAVSSPLMDAALIVYLQECAPDRVRGSMSSLFSTGYAVTCLLGMALGQDALLGKSMKLLLFVPLITGFLSTLYLLTIPDTPKYLAIKKNNEKAAKRSIAYFLGNSVDHRIEKELLEEEITDNDLKKGNISALWSCGALGRSLLLSLAALVFTLPFFPILQSSTYIFSSIGIEKEISQTSSTVLMILFTIACFISTSIIDRFPRRSFLLTCGAISMFLLLFFPISDLFFTSRYPIIFFAGIYIFIYGVGVGGVAWTVGPELVPINYRSALFCVCYALHSSLVVCTNFIVIPLFDWLGLMAIPLLYIPILGVAWILLFFKLPETNVYHGK
ncbi:unnamed protein product, partial [Mesorhabditis belari]|uniref:Major facilitator superfamily (MFS) profile domain-containing protein n=1 Tax=Mesorhabditis belari TaxID=2138241 RepID=A0AAF3FP54_9BILA